MSAFTKGQGVGPVGSFMCIRCNKSRLTGGRQFIPALKTYICGTCAEARASKRKEAA